MIDIPTELIVRARSGDMNAFEEIYRAACDYVYTIVLRITASPEDADEAAQDVFLSVYRNLGRFGFRSSFKTWLYRIAVNTAINTYKKRRRELGRTTEYDEAAGMADEKTTPRDEAASNEAGELVQSLLSELHPDFRACVVLRDIQGLTYKEIADVLKININTVRSRLSRARQRLVEIRKERGGAL